MSNEFRKQGGTHSLLTDIAYYLRRAAELASLLKQPHPSPFVRKTVEELEPHCSKVGLLAAQLSIELQESEQEKDM